MPYIVEKDNVKGTRLTRDAVAADTRLYVANLVDDSGLVSLLQAGVATIYDDVGGIDPLTGLRVNTEAITITGTGTDATLGDYVDIAAPGLTNSYTAQLSGNFYQADIALLERVEFNIPIKTRWCKIAQIKIVQLIAGKMDISFEVWEETPIYDGNRIEMHKNVIRRNITMTAAQGGWYGESLVNNLILYMDRDDPPYNLHCALVNEPNGTVSDFSVLFKIVEIGERV